MSLCQPHNGKHSCGSCCGIFNLELTTPEIKNLLQERTGQFEETVDFGIQHSIPSFRQTREKTEASLPKKDPTTYNCPFLGYIDSKKERIGCMIHPVRTGNPKSQNYSFYGSSICLGYECKNMERKTSFDWEDLFQEISKDSLQYSQLAANHILIQRIESLLEFSGIEIKKFILNFRADILDLLEEVWNLHQTEERLTSFEIDYDKKEDREKIIEKLKELLGEDSPSLCWFLGII
jgi:hypothetical protein